MEERASRTVASVFAKLGRWQRIALAPALAALLCGGCAGRYKGPRTAASLGALAVVGGSVTWAAGESFGSESMSRGMATVGLVSAAVGLAAIVAAGGWMATSVACKVDPDCDEEEQCREIPAPPGGIPYKQCMPR